MQLKIKKLHPNAQVPAAATSGSAGLDLCACLECPAEILPGQRLRVPTGLSIALPDPAFAAFAFARSGLASRHGLALANSVGVIDSDYRGEVILCMINHGTEAYTILPGERVAQLVILPVCVPQVLEVDELTETDRGTGGFGSTGK